MAEEGIKCPEGQVVVKREKPKKAHYCRAKKGVAKKEHYKRVLNVLDDMLYYIGNQETSVLDYDNVQTLKDVHFKKWTANYAEERVMRNAVKDMLDMALADKENKSLRFTGRFVGNIESIQNQVRKLGGL